MCKRRTNVTEQIGVDSDPIGALKRGQVIFAIAEATLPSENGKDVQIQRLKFRLSTEDRKFGWVSKKARDGKTDILVLESEDLVHRTKIDQIDRTDSERYTRVLKRMMSRQLAAAFDTWMHNVHHNINERHGVVEQPLTR